MSAIRLSALLLVVGAIFLFSAGEAGAITTTIRVSSNAAGLGGDLRSNGAAVSDDGRYIAFRSKSTNLVTPDTNDVNDIFVLDTDTGVLERVSDRYNGDQTIGDVSTPAISGDGRFIVFLSSDPFMTPVETPNRGVYVYDRQTTTLENVHVSSDGDPADDSAVVSSSAPNFRLSVSDNGRYVAFASYASNLVPGDTPNTKDVFVHDRLTGSTQMISGPSSDATDIFDMSSDGRYFAFQTDESLVPTDTNGERDLYVYDRQTSTYDAVTEAAGVQGAFPTISDDGRFVAYADYSPRYTIKVIDRQDYSVIDVGVSDLISQISDDGRYVVFNQGTGEPDGPIRIYRHDLQTGETILASKATDGTPSNNYSRYPVVSADGSFVAFESRATNLAPNETNGSEYDVFLFAADVSCSDDADCDDIVDASDNCALIPNTGQENFDGDSEGDACDADDDNDGLADVDDPCDFDTDCDDDGVLDDTDNCPATANPDQVDADDDGRGDACRLMRLDVEEEATPANTATSIGSTEVCREIAFNGVQDADEDGVDTISVDVVADATEYALSGFQFTLNYDPAVLQVSGEDQNYLIYSSGGTVPVPLSDFPSDSDGAFFGALADFGPNYEYGPGVLTRLTFQAVSAAPTYVPLTFTDAFLMDESSTAHSVVAGSAALAVNGTCGGDADGDGLPAWADNCPNVPNQGQQDEDSDGLGDVCDDGDGDGWLDSAEAMIGTDKDSGCGYTPGGDTASESWPADLVESDSVTISDVLAMKPVFNTGGVGTERYDLVPNGSINISDVLAIKPVFGMSCTP